MAATFGWLCVETIWKVEDQANLLAQPPSGGCVLKQQLSFQVEVFLQQPPSGGCVLKRLFQELIPMAVKQPPSGGCVLKLYRANT